MVVSSSHDAGLPKRGQRWRRNDLDTGVGHPVGHADLPAELIEPVTQPRIAQVNIDLRGFAVGQQGERSRTKRHPDARLVGDLLDGRAARWCLSA
jgi:hypothetical protein